MDTVDSNLNVVWTPGMRHPASKHIHAADAEGSWIPDPGYNWVDPKINLDVVWTKGMSHHTSKHVCASDIEG